jgi:hypothetical protein
MGSWAIIQQPRSPVRSLIGLHTSPDTGCARAWQRVAMQQIAAGSKKFAGTAVKRQAGLDNCPYNG